MCKGKAPAKVPDRIHQGLVMAGLNRFFRIKAVEYLVAGLEEDQHWFWLSSSRKLPYQVDSSKLEFSSFNFLIYMAGGIHPSAS